MKLVFTNYFILHGYFGSKSIESFIAHLNDAFTVGINCIDHNNAAETGCIKIVCQTTQLFNRL